MVVRDPSKVDAASLKKIDGVLGVEVRENQVQVIVGQIIEDLFLEVEKRVRKASKMCIRDRSGTAAPMPV